MGLSMPRDRLEGWRKGLGRGSFSAHEVACRNRSLSPGRLTAVAEAESSTAFADGGFVVELDRFSGPLDLLLHLIREQDVDIFDIPIAEITAQFLAAVRLVEVLGLDRAGEFLEMAATLVR